MSTDIFSTPFLSAFTLDGSDTDDIVDSDALLDDMEEDDFEELEEFADEEDEEDED